MPHISIEAERLLEGSHATSHLVQFYSEEKALVRNVGDWLSNGAARGDWMIVIATPPHRELFVKQLRQEGVDIDTLLRRGRLNLLDAREVMSRFMVDGQPDWKKFNDNVGKLVRDTRSTAGPSELRAYGEMVDLLWKAGQLEAATKLEEFWNRLLDESHFGLFCAYSLDMLDPALATADLQAMLHVHSHLLPVRRDRALEHAVVKALEEVLGAESTAALLPLIERTKFARAKLPKAEATVLWLRSHLPEQAARVLDRARRHFRECA